MSTSKVNNKNLFMKVHDLGLIDYRSGLSFQEKLHKVVKNENKDQIILLEHEKVITIGTKGSNKDILFSQNELEKQGFTIWKTDRGGQATIHNEGQCVVYMLIRLKKYNLKPVDFVRKVEKLIGKLLEDFSIDSEVIEGKTGVWVKSGKIFKKIAAIGVRVSEGITLHGFALNVNNELNDFNTIVPCGLPQSKVTSMKNELYKEINKDSLKERLMSNIKEIFDCEVNFG